MSWSTPKLPPSESRKGLLSSPKTLFGTPSTVNHPDQDQDQDRTAQSPEVEHRGHHDRLGSFGLVDTDTTGKTPTRSKFSTFASSFRPAIISAHDVGVQQRTDDWEDDLKNLDRDQVLNPDYTRVGHISSVFQTNPMLNLYSDETANSTGVPLEDQSDPPGKGTEGAGVEGAGHKGGPGEEDEIDLRPPPSVHDEHVSSQKSSVERLRRRLESERVSISNPIPIHHLNVNLNPNSNSNSAGGTQEVEMNSSIAMQEQLAKIFDLQMRLADMHGEMEGIDEVGGDDLGDDDDEVDKDVGHGDGDEKDGKKDEKETKKDLPKSPKKPNPPTPRSKKDRDAFSPKSPVEEFEGKTKTQDEEEGEETDGMDQRGAKREMQIGDIVDKLSDLSTLLHQFHSMPHPNLDSAFQTSPASASSFAKQNIAFEAMSRRPTVGGGKAQGAA